MGNLFRRHSAVAGIAGVLVLPMALTGCFSTSSSPASSSSQSEQQPQKQASDGKQERLLDNALDMLQPERLGINADAKTAVAMLNDWLRQSATSLPSPSAEKTWQQLLEPEELQRLGSRRFLAGDARHVRNCLLEKRISNHVARTAETELGRVVAVFDYVVRNVSLSRENRRAVPLTPYEILLLGRGTAKDRAWLVANLLRQLRIDAVRLLPESTAAGESSSQGSSWLLGVLLNGSIYLFDARLGWPIPAPDAEATNPTVQQPATLRQVLTEKGVLRQFDLPERPYALKAADLKDLRVELIGNTSFWAPRMKELHRSLAGDRAVIVYDGLHDDELGRGLLSRVAESPGGQWHREEIGIWHYPQQQLAAFGDLDEEQSARLRVLMNPLQAPVGGGGQPQRKQHKTRIRQLLGDYAPAIQSYLTIRLAEFPENIRVPPEIRRMHARAAEDAFYWMGVCQFEQRKFAAAEETFRGYLKRYPTGKWSLACRYLLGCSLARKGELGGAVFVLEELAADEKTLPSFQLLIRRLQKLREVGRARCGERVRPFAATT